MRLGLMLRNMGDGSTAEVLRAHARTAEAAGLDAVWVSDHLAIPPDDAEGSGGYYAAADEAAPPPRKPTTSTFAPPPEPAEEARAGFREKVGADDYADAQALT